MKSNLIIDKNTSILAIIISFIFFMFCNNLNAQEFNSDLMNTTYKLIVKKGDGNYIGTCFIVSKPSYLYKNMSYSVLVTAKHCLTNSISDSAEIYLRKKIDSVNYDLYSLKFPILYKGQQLWFTYPYDTVDLAVMYINIPTEFFFKRIPLEYLATEEYMKYIELHPGDELNLLGFPSGYASTDYGFPVLTSGKIASYPLFPIEKIKRFLVDVNHYSGNSGGPLYIYDIGRAFGDGVHFDIVVNKIIGLLSTELIDEDSNEKMKLAYIIPAPYITKTINLLPKLD